MQHGTFLALSRKPAIDSNRETTQSSFQCFTTHISAIDNFLISRTSTSLRPKTKLSLYHATYPKQARTRKDNSFSRCGGTISSPVPYNLLKQNMYHDVITLCLSPTDKIPHPFCLSVCLCINPTEHCTRLLPSIERVLISSPRVA